MKQECNINESEVCFRCSNKICSGVSILETILSSGDARKISNLSAVLNQFDMKVMDLIGREGYQTRGNLLKPLTESLRGVFKRLKGREGISCYPRPFKSLK